MSFIEMPGLADAKEPKIVPEGADYDLVIVSATLKEKEGKKNILTVLEIEGYENTANVMHNISLVSPDDEDDKRKFKALMQARFFYQFGIETDGGVELEQIVGHRANNCKLKVGEFNNQKKNELQLDPLPTEDE